MQWISADPIPLAASRVPARSAPAASIWEAGIDDGTMAGRGVASSMRGCRLRRFGGVAVQGSPSIRVRCTGRGGGGGGDWLRRRGYGLGGST